MDGTLAAVFLVASLTDMVLTDCKAGACLAPSEATSRLSFQAAEVQFGDKKVGNEIYIGYDLGTAYGPFQPRLGSLHPIWAITGLVLAPNGRRRTLLRVHFLSKRH